MLKKLLQLLSDKNKSEFLQAELEVVIDAGEPFVKATYKLEGDGALAFTCYKVYIVHPKQLYDYSTTLISVLWLISYLESQLHYIISLCSMEKLLF